MKMKMDTDTDMDMDTVMNMEIRILASHQLQNQFTEPILSSFPRKTALRTQLNAVSVLYGIALYHSAALRLRVIPSIGLIN